jgi:hypothetical protein
MHGLPSPFSVSAFQSPGVSPETPSITLKDDQSEVVRVKKVNTNFGFYEQSNFVYLYIQ